MTRGRAGRLLGERLQRDALSAARVGNFEQANYWKSLPTERHLRALAEVYAPARAQEVADELVGYLRATLAGSGQEEAERRHPGRAIGVERASREGPATMGIAGRDAVTADLGLPGTSVVVRSRAQEGGGRDDPAYGLCLQAAGLLGSNAEPDIVAALALLRRACDLDPGIAEAHAWLAYGLWRRYFAGWDASTRTLTAALHHASTALELDERCTAARTARIRIYWDLGLHERGIAEGVTAVHESPGSVSARLSLARAFNNAGLADVALPITASVLQTDRTNVAARKLLVWNHLMVGDHSAAVETAQTYWAGHVVDANTAWAVTAALWHLGRMGDAVDAAMRALAADDVNFTLWVLLGYVQRAAGDEAAAQTTWRQGLAALARRQPAGRVNHRAAAWVANLHAATGARAEAARLLRATRLQEPTNGYVAYRLAHVAAELGDVERALALLGGAVQGGFLSVQLLRCEESSGLARLTERTDYGALVKRLEQRVADVREKYVPLLAGT